MVALDWDVWPVVASVIPEIQGEESSRCCRHFAHFFDFFHLVVADLWSNLYSVVVLEVVPGIQKKSCFV